MFNLYDFAKIIPEVIILGDKNTPWKHISIDSRTIQAGELFIALKGEKYDGHDFIKEAFTKGAAGVVLEKRYLEKNPFLFKELKKPLLAVDNTIKALQMWANYYHSLFRPFNICITGSNGKTTTKEMIVSLLSNRYNVLKSKGNYNNEIGVPLTILGLSYDHDVLVMEMAARKLGEIKELTEIVKPDIAVVTNIGDAHLGLFESKDNIAREKSELFLALKDKGTAIINRDDVYYAYLLNCVSAHNEVISFGFHPQAQVRAINFRQKNEQVLHFELLLSGKDKFQVFLPLMGKFNVLNALAAIAVGIKMNIPIKEIVDSLANFKGVDLRMEYLLLEKGIILIEDYYNANPTATIEALQSVASIAGDRFKVAILGDMLELGDFSIGNHNEIGRKVAALSYDMLITYGDYGNFIIQGAQKEGMRKGKIYHFRKEEKEKLAHLLSQSIPQHSIVLLKGSRALCMEDIVRLWKVIRKGKRSTNYA